MNGSRVAKDFDKQASFYAGLYAGRSRIAHFFNMRVQRVLEILGEVDGGDLLEVGCGPGPIVQRLLDRGFRYYGVDVSEGMIEECARRFADAGAARFEVGDARRLDYPARKFDVVLCLGMIEYVAEEEAVIRELARVLKPGGLLVISGINAWSPYNAWDRLLRRPITGFKSSATIVHEYHTERGYRRMLSDHGLSVQDVVFFDFNLMLPPLDRRLVRLGVGWSDRLEGHCRGRLRKLGNGFLVKCRKACHNAARAWPGSMGQENG